MSFLEQLEKSLKMIISSDEDVPSVGQSPEQSPEERLWEIVKLNLKCQSACVLSKNYGIPYVIVNHNSGYCFNFICIEGKLLTWSTTDSRVPEDRYKQLSLAKMLQLDFGNVNAISDIHVYTGLEHVSMYKTPKEDRDVAFFPIYP